MTFFPESLTSTGMSASRDSGLKQCSFHPFCLNGQRAGSSDIRQQGRRKRYVTAFRSFCPWCVFGAMCLGRSHTSAAGRFWYATAVDIRPAKSPPWIDKSRRALALIRALSTEHGLRPWMALCYFCRSSLARAPVRSIVYHGLFVRNHQCTDRVFTTQ